MWGFDRYPEYYKQYCAADVRITTAEAAAAMPFPAGLLVSFVLVAPFWTGVALLVHHLAK